MKPTIPEVVDRFRAYYKDNPAWGSLHIVLDDGNVRDSDVEFCRLLAQKRDDVEGESLAEILAQMSKTQRIKLGQLT